MSSLRDRVLAAFSTGARITLVADPDGLVADELVISQLQQRGFGVLTFDPRPNGHDPMALRYQYESEFRLASVPLIVLVNGGTDAFERLPWDIVSEARQNGQELRFGLNDLFPNLHTDVVAALERADLDTLYREQGAMHLDFGPHVLGAGASQDFVLRRVFGLDMEQRPTEIDALVAVLRLHETRRQLPDVLAGRVAALWRRNKHLADWPLEMLLTSALATYAFLQERWPAFVRLQFGQMGVSEAAPLAYAGPALLPFGAAQVRAYVDTLFLDGRLRPVNVEIDADPQKPDALLSLGIRTDGDAARGRRLARLLNTLTDKIPASDARHTDWIAYALQWSEAITLWHAQAAQGSEAVAPAESELSRQFESLRQRIDMAFHSWMQRSYSGLHNLAPSTPVMVHHIPRAIARQLRVDPQQRRAMVVIDGLALDQWPILRETVRQQRPLLRIQDSAVFAWTPTITSISRQALFAGRPPALFPDRVASTSGEGQAWREFWSEQGIATPQVGYVNALRGDGDLPQLRNLAHNPSLRVIGAVFDVVDQIMHGTPLGMLGMRSQVQLWAQQGVLARALDVLLEQGFDVVLTSDHGNIEALGMGIFTDGALTELRGKRARVYGTAALRHRASERFPTAIEWPQIGLPPDYFALLAPGRAAFAPEGERFVTHGGIALEEIVVPYSLIRHDSGERG